MFGVDGRASERHYAAVRGDEVYSRRRDFVDHERQCTAVRGDEVYSRRRDFVDRRSTQRGVLRDHTGLQRGRRHELRTFRDEGGGERKRQRANGRVVRDSRNDAKQLRIQLRPRGDGVQDFRVAIRRNESAHEIRPKQRGHVVRLSGQGVRRVHVRALSRKAYHGHQDTLRGTKRILPVVGEHLRLQRFLRHGSVLARQRVDAVGVQGVESDHQHDVLRQQSDVFRAR